MQDFINTRLLAVLISVVQLFSLPGMAWAQQADIDPPVIEFEAVSSGNAGDSQVFAATVADNAVVQSVSLYYRFAESTAFDKRSMTMLGTSGIYTVSITGEEQPTDSTFIQYYIEAFDEAGNRALQGFAFDPIERQLVTPVATAGSQVPVEPIESTGMSLNRKILYGAVGLLVIGVLASAAGGGGGSSSAGVPVTVVVGQIP